MEMEALHLIAELRTIMEWQEYQGKALAFSGGLDSSILARLAVDPALHVVGMEGSQDLVFARKAAALMGLDLQELVITKEDVEATIAPLGNMLGTTSALTISFEMPLYFIAKNVKHDTIITGQGADELFGGYARYQKMDRKSLQKSLEEDIEKVLVETLPNEIRMVQHFEKDLRVPYMKPTIMGYALHLPSELKVISGQRKVLLRGIGRTLNLPEEIVKRPKKAAQYGSNITKAMRTLAKKEGMKTGDYVKTVVEKKMEDV